MHEPEGQEDDLWGPLVWATVRLARWSSSSPTPSGAAVREGSIADIEVFLKQMRGKCVTRLQIAVKVSDEKILPFRTTCRHPPACLGSPASPPILFRARPCRSRSPSRFPDASRPLNADSVNDLLSYHVEKFRYANTSRSGCDSARKRTSEEVAVRGPIEMFLRLWQDHSRPVPTT